MLLNGKQVFDNFVDSFHPRAFLFFGHTLNPHHDTVTIFIYVIVVGFNVFQFMNFKCVFTVRNKVSDSQMVQTEKQNSIKIAALLVWGK